MATIKKPAKKMQEGGKVKIKIKIKPDNKKSNLDKFGLDKASKDAGFETNPARKATFNVPEVKQQKKGGVTKKAKSGGSFPDLNKDGKITKADILKGRGVIAKKGASIKKAQTGNNIKVNPPAGYTKGSGYKSFGKSGVSVKKMQYGGEAASMVPPMMKKGGATKKCKYGCK
jgi:hypothetical protein